MTAAVAPCPTARPQVAAVDAAGSVRDIGWLCRCPWNPPDYFRPPRQRRWTLTSPDPECKVQRHARGAAG